MQLVGNALSIAKRRELDTPIALAFGVSFPAAFNPVFFK